MTWLSLLRANISRQREIADEAQHELRQEALRARIAEMSISKFMEDMNGIIRWFHFEQEDIRDDLASIELSKSEPKVLNIGCDVGVETIALASVLDASEVIGIDKRPDAIAMASRWREEAERYIRISEGNGDSVNKALVIFGVRSFPEFVTGDVVSGQNLPVQVDLVYSRKVLVPIHENEYDNPISGDNGVIIAIDNMAKTMRSGEWAIFIEKNLRAYNINKHFTDFIEQAGLNLIKAEPLTRSDILSTGKRSIAAHHYIRYISRKT
jgi:SAM-dependent methyltransferase